MKTKKQVLETIKNGRDSQCLDGRDYSRLANFFPLSDWKVLGFSLKKEADLNNIPSPVDWTKENILEQLRKDVAFGFEKALNQRGISSSLMYEVAKMWLWILDDELECCQEYAQYGLPLFKKIAVKYGFDNLIGDSNGNESKYEAR